MKKNPLNLLLIWCATLVLVRIFQLQNPGILFLVWNLFLAWIPWALMQHFTNVEGKWQQWLILACAFLFLPNAPYIVTDLMHLKRNLGAPIWFDSILFLSFAFTGLYCFLLAFEKISLFLQGFFARKFYFEILRFSLLILCGYGVYLGRYLRLNSWDLLTHPKHLANEIIYSFHPLNISMAISVSLLYGLFLYVLILLYSSFKKQVRYSSERDLV